MIADAPLGPAPCSVRDAHIVELPWGGSTVVKVCACGHRRRSMPRNYADGRGWECVHCGRRVQ